VFVVCSYFPVLVYSFNNGILVATAAITAICAAVMMSSIVGISCGLLSGVLCLASLCIGAPDSSNELLNWLLVYYGLHEIAFTCIVDNMLDDELLDLPAGSCLLATHHAAPGIKRAG
jgi:hypothetical protein